MKNVMGRNISVVVCICMMWCAVFLNCAYAGGGNKFMRVIKPAKGIIKKGTARVVGTCTKWAGTAELVAKVGVRTQAYYEAKAKLDSANLPLEIRERYLNSLLKRGSAEGFEKDVDVIGPMNKRVDINNRIRKLKRGAPRFEHDWQRKNRLRKIEKLERQKEEVSKDLAQKQRLVDSYRESLRKVKTEEGRRELAEDLGTVRENLGENYDLHADFINDTGNEIAGDFVQYVNGEVVGTVTSEGLGEVAERTGVLPQLQGGICPESKELTKAFTTDIEGVAIQTGADKAGVSLEVPGLQDVADWLMEDPVETARKREELEREDAIVEQELYQLEQMSPAGLGSELEIMDGISAEDLGIYDSPAGSRAIDPSMVRKLQRRVRRSNPANWIRAAEEELMTMAELERITSDNTLGAGYKIDACMKYQNQRIARMWYRPMIPSGIRPPGQIDRPSIFVTRIPSKVEYHSSQLKRQQQQQSAMQTMQAIGAFAGAISAASQSSAPRHDSREGHHAPGTCGRK